MPPFAPTARGPGLALALVIAAWLLVEIIVSALRQGGPRTVRHERSSPFVLVGGVGLGLALGLLIAWRWPAGVPAALGPWPPWLGLGCILAGVLIRWYAIATLGACFTPYVATEPQQRLVRRGPYRWVRHPAYGGALLALLGVGLALGNGGSALAILAGAGVGYGYRVRSEERALAAAWGAPYIAYMRATRRFVPFLW